MTFAEIIGRVDVWLGYLLTLISLISFVVAIIKAIKNKKYNEIVNCMIGFIQDAETFTCKNGETVDGSVKKEIVLSKIRNICNNLNYKYDETTWSNLVDNYVEFTLRVNQREKDKDKLIEKQNDN